MNELGEGNVKRLLFKLAVPSILAQLINALYNVVDRIYLGRIPGAGGLALTGVGVAFPVLMVISAVGSMIGMGGAPRASIEMGKGTDDKAERIMTTSFTLLMTFGILLMAVFFIFKDKMLMAFGASEATLPYASGYLSVYLCGTLFVLISLGMNAFITSQGFALYSMATVLIGAVMNIILDPIMIFGLNMGVKGAALASVISQGISAVWVMVFLAGKKTKLHLRKKYISPDLRIVGAILSLGISPFIMQSTESLLNIVMNSSLQKYGGDIAVGSMTIIASISQFALLPIMGLAQGAQPIISYNYGAKRPDRIREAFRTLLVAAVSYSVVYCLMCILFPKLFVGIFTSDASLLAAAPHYLRIYIAGTWAMGAQLACQNSFIALGDAKSSLFLALLRKIILLIPLIYILSYFMQTIGVFTAEPIADIVASAVTTTMFVAKFGKMMKKIEN